jgi:membrane protease YdiL (CAAX protease family)
VRNSSQTNSGDLTEAYRSSRSGAARRVFIGEQGIRPVWSVLLFAAIYLTLEALVLAALGHFVPLDVVGPIPFHLALLQESCEVLVVLVATLVMARVENRRLLSYGYTGEHRAIRLVSGVAWGFLCLSALIGILWKARLLVFDGQSLTGLIAWKYALAWALIFLLVGIFEESLLRGYLQYTLSRGVGFWWAAVLLSVVFALGHLSNGGESPLGLLEVFGGGFVFCLSLWYTKSLWWAVGFHAGWDWAQSYFYGTADSGLVVQNHLFASHPSGNPLWSGGTTGPEGSLLVLPLLIIVATGNWLWWGAKRKSGANSATAASNNR